MPFHFTLKDQNQKSYNRFIWFLFFFHIAAAAFIALNSAENKVRLSVLILLGFYLLLYIGYYFFRTRKKALETVSLIWALLYANFWFQHAGIITVILFAVIFLWVTIVKGKKTTIFFSDEGVHLTRVFKTVIFPWAVMENVIIKDSLLTLDFKTNKVIQAEVVEDAIPVDEENFNRFCMEQMRLNP